MSKPGPAHPPAVTVYGALTRLDVQADVRLQPPSPLPTNQIGRFQIIGELGRGGMGVVYDAEDPELQRRVAIKVLNAHAALHPGGVEQFVVEARLTSQLDHPNIVPVHEMGITDEGQLFFVMKKVTGQSLAARIAQLREGRAQQSLHGRLVAFQRLCQAVAFAHDRGVVHRDIKPQNVMVGRFGELLLTDWGIARIMTSADAQARGSGTPGYIAPEVVQGQPGDERADLFALGAVLYELLTFVRAFEPTLSFDPAWWPPQRGLPDALYEIIGKAIAYQPSHRYASVSQLIAAIEAYLDGSRRRAEAGALLARAQQKFDEISGLHHQLDAAVAHCQQLMKSIEAYEPIEVKLPLWDAREHIQKLRSQVAREEIAFLEAARGALARSPGLREADHLLADWFYRTHQMAEKRKDLPATARAEAELLIHDTGGRYRSYLSGEGHLTLYTDPPGATVQLFRVEERRRRYVEVLVGEPLTTPIERFVLGMGSWIAVIRAPGRATVRAPIWIARNGQWTNTPPGEDTPSPIRLPRAGVLGPDDVVVPGGWAWIGSDHPMANGALPPRQVWIDAFVMRRYMVTNREYLAFMNALVREGNEAEALQWAPRARAGSNGMQSTGSPLYGRDPQGRFRLIADVDGDIWDPEWPVMMINWSCAMAFARAEAVNTGRPWRLPTELEFEKAARGADGREAPYGPLVEPAWSLVASSFSGRRLPRTVHEDRADESPYGIIGLSGNVSTMCLDSRQLTLNVRNDRALVTVAEHANLEEGTINRRGGAFSLNSRVGYCASRSNGLPGFRAYYTGMRLARSLTEDDY
ncbi:MAG: bifunctional serine/threonine-protein kinase/formylglycine-generating enzyme family protein [Myxococcota bacterium]